MTSLSPWYGPHYYIEYEVCYNSNHTCKPVRICAKYSDKNCLPLPIFTRCCRKCFGAFRNDTCFINHLVNGVCDHSKSCDTCGGGSSVQCMITYAIYQLAVIVQNMSNQVTSVLLM